MIPFNPTRWAELYRDLRHAYRGTGSPAGVAALSAELIDLYEQLVTELSRIDPNPAQLGRRWDLLIADRDALLSECLQLARIGLEMRRAQRTYFRKRKEQPHANLNVEYRIAREAEERFDSATHAALQREQLTLPGMSGSDLV